MVLENFPARSYLTISATRIAEQEADAKVKEMQRELLEEAGEEQPLLLGPPLKTVWNGTPVDFVGRLDEWCGPYAAYRGLLLRDNAIYELLFECPVQGDQPPTALLEEALECVRFLTPEETSQIEEKAASLPDGGNWAGDRACIRNGNYHDFQYGFSWSPPHSSWRLTSYPSPADSGEVRLTGRDPRSGVLLDLWVAATDMEDEEKFHESSLSQLLDETKPHERFTIEVELNDGPAYQSSVLEEDESGLTRWWVLTTALRNGFAYEISLEFLAAADGFPDEDVADILAGFAFAKRPETELSGESYIDHRMGFSLTNPAIVAIDSKFETVNAFPNLKLLSFRASSAEVVVAAHTSQPGLNIDWAKRRLGRVARLQQQVDLQSTEQTKAFGEPKVRRRIWKSKEMTYHLFDVTRDNTTYTMVVYAPTASALPPAAVDELVDSLRLID